MSTADRNEAFRRRIDQVRERVDIGAVVGAVVKLGRGKKPRGKCPFHGSKSDSFAVDPDRGTARCWGCGWSGDVIRFVSDHYNLPFLEAVKRLEEDHRLDGLAADPVRRQKRNRRAPERAYVDSRTMGRVLWKRSVPDLDAIRVYLRARGIPDALLTAERLADFRFVGLGPIAAWAEDAKPDSVPQAPAIVALMRRVGDWQPVGVHATFLSPALDRKMARKRADGENYPERKMLGPSAGACVLLPGAGSSTAAIDGAVPLYVGEGNETVLSGLSVCSAGAEACGIAMLSLDTLQGQPQLIRGALPLYDPRPDPRSPPATIAHQGLVTGLIDGDMSPLRGPVDHATGRRRGVPIIEWKGGPVVTRPLWTAERAELCARLFVHGWRAAGCRATALRPRLGQDFNDAIQEGT